MIIVLAMHGMPPKDFPDYEKKEFMRLHAQVGHSTGEDPVKKRHDTLDAKMRNWPRTEENDAFWKASHDIALQLKEKTGSEVIVGFNEFCAPTVEEALNQAAETGDSDVVVITPMVTRGGSHAEEEIPEIVKAAQKRYPKVNFSYAWPFEAERTAAFLADQVQQFVKQS